MPGKTGDSLTAEGLARIPGVARAAACVCLFALVWITHSLSPNATPFDSRWVVHTALSILHQGNTDLDEYLELLEKDKFYGIECVGADGRHTYPLRQRAQCAGGHYYNYYPVAVPALVTPAVWLLETGLKLAQPWLGPLADRMPTQVRRSLLRGDLVASSAAVEVLVASAIIAAATVVTFLIACQFLSLWRAFLLALVLAFATSAWSVASRGLWQHGPSMLVLAVALLLVLRAERRPQLIRLAGLPLVLGFFLRPTNILPLAALSLYVLARHRRHFLPYVLWAAPVGVLFLAYDWSVYGGLLAPYFHLQRGVTPDFSLDARFFEALAGNLWSPARGLFVFTPIALLSVYGMLLPPPGATARRLRPYLIAVVILHWGLMSVYEDWWGGHSFGPRYFSDMLPFLCYFLIPVLERIPGRKGLTVAFAVLAAASFFVHWQGATNWACYAWSMNPVDVNAMPSRLWDWNDPPFLRGLRR